jgi:hypothetical protein
LHGVACEEATRRVVTPAKHQPESPRRRRRRRRPKRRCALYSSSFFFFRSALFSREPCHFVRAYASSRPRLLSGSPWRSGGQVACVFFFFFFCLPLKGVSLLKGKNKKKACGGLDEWKVSLNFSFSFETLGTTNCPFGALFFFLAASLRPPDHSLFSSWQGPGTIAFLETAELWLCPLRPLNDKTATGSSGLSN